MSRIPSFATNKPTTTVNWQARCSDIEMKLKNKSHAYDLLVVKSQDDLQKAHSELDIMRQKLSESESKMTQCRDRLALVEEELTNCKANNCEFQKAGEIKSQRLTQQYLRKETEFHEKITQLEEENVSAMKEKLEANKRSNELSLEMENLNVKLRISQEKIDGLLAKVEEMSRNCALNDELTEQCENLQRKLQENADNIEYNASMRRKIAQLQVLENENKKLLIENTELKNNQVNVRLLMEERDHLLTSAQSADQLRLKLAALEEEMYSLKAAAATATASNMSSVCHSPQLSDHSSSATTLGKQNNSLRRENMILTDSFAELQSKYNAALEGNARLQKVVENEEKQSNLVNLLNAELQTLKQTETVLLTRCQFYQRELEKYDSLLMKHGSQGLTEMSSCKDSDNEIKFLRQEVKNCDQLIASYKNMLHNVKQTMMNEGGDGGAAPNAKGSENVSVQCNIEQALVVQLRHSVAELEMEKATLQAKVNDLEMHFENLTDQGLLNAEEYKVLHFKGNAVLTEHNVSETAEQSAATLAEENSRLKQRCMILEDRINYLKESLNKSLLPAESDCSTQTMAGRGQAKSSDEGKDLQEKDVQIKTLRLQLDKLQDVFMESATSYRNAVKCILGFRVGMVTNEMYDVSSVFSPDPRRDTFRFKLSEDSVQMMDTAFSQQHQDLVDVFIGEHKSPPALFANFQNRLFQSLTLVLP